MNISPNYLSLLVFWLVMGLSYVVLSTSSTTITTVIRSTE